MTESFLKFLQYEKRVSPHTLSAYANDLKQFEDFSKQQFGENNIQSATYALIRAWIVQLTESGIEPASINRKIATLRTYFKFLLRQELIEKNPMVKIRVLKTRKRLPGFVKETEITPLLDNPREPFADNLQGHRNRLILEMFYATGIRLSELLRLQEKNVDMRSRTIKVLGKRNKERLIPFGPSIVPIIEAYRGIRDKEVEKRTHGLFFVNDKGGACYPMMVYRMVKKYIGENTTADKRSPHVLRHTFATHLLNKGAEINAVKELLGHSSLAATQVYTHNSMEKLKKVFDQAHPKA